MEFYIRKNSTEPTLKLKLADDGRNVKSTVNDLLENSNISFSMYDIKTNKPIILNGGGSLSIRRERLNQDLEEYGIIYQFKEGDTTVAGRYEGIFRIDLLDTDLNVTSKLIVPIKEKLFINVI